MLQQYNTYQNTNSKCFKQILKKTSTSLSPELAIRLTPSQRLTKNLPAQTKCKATAYQQKEHAPGAETVFERQAKH
jgi:hypothetical protein